LDRITQTDDTLAQARELTHGFLDLIRHHSGEGLDTWLKDARASTVRQFSTFARSIERDKAAILAGLTLPYSTGPVEGHINRLKPDLSASVWQGRAFLLATPLLVGCMMSRLRQLVLSLRSSQQRQTGPGSTFWVPNFAGL